MPHINIQTCGIGRCLAVFLSGLVLMYHLRRSTIHTWDPAAKHNPHTPSTHTHTFRLLQLFYERGGKGEPVKGRQILDVK